nr:MAG TPA: hypothetical protein [Caudoviricetes sp.]DAJ96345.1 MAG TPA: hypothetical protein [Caudoviricetes sp.]
MQDGYFFISSSVRFGRFFYGIIKSEKVGSR